MSDRATYLTTSGNIPDDNLDDLRRYHGIPMEPTFEELQQMANLVRSRTEALNTALDHAWRMGLAAGITVNERSILGREQPQIVLTANIALRL